jgi:hypothetical protein
VLGKFPVPVYGWRGAFTGMHVDEFLGESNGKMLMESGLAAPVQLMAQNELSMGVDHIRFMEEFKYFSALNVLIPDKVMVLCIGVAQFAAVQNVLNGI